MFVGLYLTVCSWIVEPECSAVESRTVIIKWLRMKQVVWRAMLPPGVGGEIGDLHFSFDNKEVISSFFLFKRRLASVFTQVLGLFSEFRRV